MKHILTAAAGVAVFAAGAGTLSAAEEHTYLILFEDEAAPEMVEEAGGDVDLVLEELDLITAALSEEEAAALLLEDEILSIDVDEETQLELPIEEPADDGLFSIASTNWGYNKVNVQSAADAGLDGSGISVAVLDTGISTTHPDLDVADGYNFFSNNTNYDDDNGHGSHVAGILAGTGNLTGVAPGVDLYAVKIMDDRGQGRHSVMAAGIDWALEKDIDIINMSIGGEETSRTLELATRRAEEHGTMLVAAAGNRGATAGLTTTVDYPGRLDNVIAVGALDQQDRRASFSGYGPQVEVSAPGTGIYSAGTGRTYLRKSGTSMATPYVSGMLAIMMEAQPSKEPVELRSQLRTWVQPLGTTQPNRNTGYGRVIFPNNIEIEEAPAEPVIDIQARADSITTERATVNVNWEDRERPEGSTYVLRRNGERVYAGTDQRYTDTITADGDYRYTVRVRQSSDNVSPVMTSSELRIRLNDPYADVLSRYHDVAENGWYVSEVAPLIEKGLIGGYESAEGPELRPLQPITRAEAVTILARERGWNTIDRSTTFPDVSDRHFARGSIAEAERRNVIGGYADGTVRPNDPISRAELTVMLSRVYSYPAQREAPAFTDVRTDRYYSGSLLQLLRAGIIDGYPDNTFRPDNEVTRAEFAVMVNRTLNQ
ncbi:S8 family peptidase [Alkalicoccus urumqiensis]|uniref:SLH domain-containing protein n=1 Tax=Alkalicoccus urumqiensis TaxID=1548213 RepID=A0A2P6MHN0_ALKUR|nr:S8 family serine peptidase [Alkalicoccus urumqiensis]PRO65799.1 hypothetical protein C6I21_07835 [Alkalicoccus urumqiensis]